MNLNKKSKSTAFWLSFLLGPLGVMYGSILSGFILLVLTIATAGTVILPLMFWVGGWFVAMSAVDKHNDNIDQFIQLMKPR